MRETLARRRRPLLWLSIIAYVLSIAADLLDVLGWLVG